MLDANVPTTIGVSEKKIIALTGVATYAARVRALPFDETYELIRSVAGDETGDRASCFVMGIVYSGVVNKLMMHIANGENFDELEEIAKHLRDVSIESVDG